MSRYEYHDKYAGMDLSSRSAAKAINEMLKERREHTTARWILRALKRRLKAQGYKKLRVGDFFGERKVRDSIMAEPPRRWKHTRAKPDYWNNGSPALWVVVREMEEEGYGVHMGCGNGGFDDRHKPNGHYRPDQCQIRGVTLPPGEYDL